MTCENATLPEILELSPRLEDADPGVRRLALIELADLELPEALPLLVAALRGDPDPGVRGEAARLLEAWEEDAVVDALCAALADPLPAVAEAAAQSLGELKEPAAGRRLLPWLEHADSFVRASVLRALRELRLEESAAPALAALGDPQAAVRREAVAVLGWLRHQPALAELARLASADADPEVRRAATGALGLSRKSSTVHTHKPITPSYMKKIPLIIALMLVPIGVIVGLIMTAMQQGNEEKEAALARSQAAEASAGVLPGAGNAVQAAPRASSGPKSTDEFLGDMSPRVPDLVASAPRYDDLNKPRDFPRPVCAASSDPNLIGKAPERRIPLGTYNGRVMVCQCYTQQVTRMHTTFEFCMDVVNNGYFDDTRMPPTYASGNSTRGLITSPSVDPATAIERGRAATSPTPGDAFSTRVTIVPDSSRMPRTL